MFSHRHVQNPQQPRMLPFLAFSAELPGVSYDREAGLWLLQNLLFLVLLRAFHFQEIVGKALADMPTLPSPS